jgi:hypothetical protein
MMRDVGSMKLLLLVVLGSKPTLFCFANPDHAACATKDRSMSRKVWTAELMFLL